ncbi:hypothetical protein AUK04_03820 [Candidatus Roizmanbacteria bacterium CG2_30_33_16]|uniref:Carboxypeptidase regulatory-like domain-containing protein n=1 Tax=Candidatus Roizmanbacteria bacterium CG2_30_33_16 TaxID=1805340 RepID=A0A1J5HF33_9BACT|nr:MAG: hypothetical protein AUK04_03820 [Candidatus Roizmanbacteria bacterium CG2_30_33_16]
MKKLRIITLVGLCFISLIIIIASFLQQSNLLSNKQTTITKAEEDFCCPGGCCDQCTYNNSMPGCPDFCAAHPGDAQCLPPPQPTTGQRPTDVPGNRTCGTSCTETCSPGGGCSNGPCVWYANGDCRRACNCRGESATSYSCEPCKNDCPANPPQTGVASCSRNVCSPRGCSFYKCTTVNYVPGAGGCNLPNECIGDQNCQNCSTTPQPTATPIPPSPTPVPPTAVVTAPPAQNLSQKAGTPSKPTQAWMCLDTEFCYKSANCSKIDGVDYVHRVRLKNMDDAKLQSNTRTYIFECLQTDVGYRCTSGNSAIDNEIVGTSYLDSMLSDYGYSFIKLTASDGNTSVSQPLTTGANGELGPYEWESTTINNMGRVFFAVQNIAGSDAIDAEGALHQGTVTFEGKGGQVCLLIKYDPHGIVLDQNTNQPISEALVTLLQKDARGDFKPTTSKSLIGGIINPTLTDKNGAFAFMVPGGIYQIKVEKSGYHPYLSPEIAQKDKSEYLEVTLQRLSLIEKLTQFIFNHHL